ncbi:MAG TPA: hypothetical protein VFL59_00190 [Candidatus Nanopelagicales bacterium]|nr:hypothetical protein [Candidatus Nanopelagicales bacterium]
MAGAALATPDPAAIEAAVSVVPGVSSATVVPGQRGGPEVLRVVLDEDVDAVDVARAAQRILRLQFGVDLEPGRLEIVEGDPEPSTTVIRLVEQDASGTLLLGEEKDDVDLGALLDELDPGPGPRFLPEVLASAARHPAGIVVPDDEPAPVMHRVAVAELALSADGLDVVATVTLVHDGAPRTGSADGLPTPAATHRAIATATLRALSDLVVPGLRLEVDAVALAPVGDGTVAVVRIIWFTAEGGAEHLTGSSEVRDDARHAVIRATLDAVNRRLSLDLADR